MSRLDPDSDYQYDVTNQPASTVDDCACDEGTLCRSCYDALGENFRDDDDDQHDAEDER